MAIKNREDEEEIHNMFDLLREEQPILPKQGLSGKKHCICEDCDIFGCDENCYVCTKDFGEMENFL